MKWPFRAFDHSQHEYLGSEHGHSNRRLHKRQGSGPKHSQPARVQGGAFPGQALRTVAILRYLGKKHGLDARTERDAMELSLLEQQAHDLQWALVLTSMNPNTTQARESHERNLADSLSQWQKHLKTRKWALGDSLTYVDFLLYEAFDWNRHFAPGVFEGRPEILNYLKRFEELPKLKEYFASDKYTKWPIMAPYMFWGH
ncbi:hypothetical protein V5799_026875 [Amblyomma americanum]|uniref:glutathione transferase n=1 Tax=Amblyomma americanum TaxID=6943 RepID=A0AAQ4DHB6_AMBAM